MKVYIRLAETLGPTYAGAFEDLTIQTETVLSGDVQDDAALHGLLDRLRDLGIPLRDMRIEGRQGYSR